MHKKITTFLVAISLALVAASGVQAHEAKPTKDVATTKANAGHVGDSKGLIVLDGRGQCVKTTDYKKDKHGLVECGEIKAAAKPAPKPQPTEVKETITIGAHALFDFDKDALRPDGKAELDGLLSKAKQYDHIDSITVVGHTDSIGTEEYNQGLSERRAATVKNYLAANGMDANKISASGQGETNPVASNDTKEGRQQNRRVEITVEAVKVSVK